MNPKIDIFNERYQYGLAWFDGEDGEGLRFGDSLEVESQSKAPANRDLAEHWHAYQAAKATPGCEADANGHLRWESASAAKAARAAARAAIKTMDVPLPDWAKQALAHGWKRPRGWKP